MKKLKKLWLSSWLYIMILISGSIIGITLCHWKTWDLQQKLFATATALLPIHVLEEWHFPGGFHTMYNLMKNSSYPDCYPMNQMSDMFTNLIGVLFGCIVLIVKVNPFFCTMQLFLCFAEIFGHFSGGIYLYQRFKNKGKRTIYSPGMATVIFGYLPIAIGIIISFFTISAPTVLEFIFALISGIILGALSLKLPEMLLKNEKSPYGYTWGNGYLEQYMKGEEEDVSYQ